MEVGERRSGTALRDDDFSELDFADRTLRFPPADDDAADDFPELDTDDDIPATSAGPVTDDDDEEDLR